VSRVLKHKLRNKMRRAVREKRQGEYVPPPPPCAFSLSLFIFIYDYYLCLFMINYINVLFVDVRPYSLASEVSCKRVAARVLNKILGQHPKVTSTRTCTTAHAPPHTRLTRLFSWCAVGGLLAAVGGQVAAQALPLHSLARGARCMFILIILISYYFFLICFCFYYYLLFAYFFLLFCYFFVISIVFLIC
jgi:hypothetical protein